MTIEYRPVTTDEFDRLLEVDRTGFGQRPRKPDSPDSWARGEMERTRCAFEHGELVGASRNYSFELTLPGGALLPAAAVSWVSVLATHRRRGVLTGMIDALHNDARDHGEPVAVLTASESVIYGRFGYGISTWRLGLSVERVRAHFVDHHPDPGRMRYVTEAEASKIFPTVYDAARRGRAGMVSRPDFWWPEVLAWLTNDEFPASFRVVHEASDGSVDGYLLYGIEDPGWSQGVPSRRLHVIDLVTTRDDARAALWRFAFSVDLVSQVVAHNLPVDEPLHFMLTDPRRARVDFITDGMWLCILDEVAALSARSYATEGRVTFEVHRPGGEAGTFTLDATPDGAECRPTTTTPDILLGTSQLSAALLGGVPLEQLLRAGRIEEVRSGAVAMADAMFATAPAPAMLSWF
jgi:predicted acetyltransferase